MEQAYACVQTSIAEKRRRKKNVNILRSHLQESYELIPTTEICHSYEPLFWFQKSSDALKISNLKIFIEMRSDPL